MTSIRHPPAGRRQLPFGRPLWGELHYEAWTIVAGVHFPTKRVNYHGGLKLGEITDAAFRVNAGLALEQLAAKPSDSMPEVPRP